MTEFSDISNVLLKSGAAPSLLETLNNPEALKYFRALVVCFSSLSDSAFVPSFYSYFFSLHSLILTHLIHVSMSLPIQVTDQPYERPDTFELPNPVPSLLTRPRHLILTLSLPPSSDAASTLPLVRAVFELVDVLAAINLSSPSTTLTPFSLPPSHPARPASLLPETLRKLRLTRKEWDDRLEKERLADKLAEEDDAKRAAKKKAEEERVGKLSAGEQQKLLERERKRSLRKAQARGAKK